MSLSLDFLSNSVGSRSDLDSDLDLQYPQKVSSSLLADCSRVNLSTLCNPFLHSSEFSHLGWNKLRYHINPSFNDPKGN